MASDVLSSDLSRGIQLLRDPHLNKSTAFTDIEREKLGLLGLLPEGVDSEENQLRRVLLQLSQKTTDLERYIYLTSLQDNNETLYYKTLMSDPAHFMPLVYTPTVGEACQKFGHILRRPRGLYLAINRRGRLAELLRNWPYEDIGVIVVTDGERILGLGDLGAGGMGIPVGKLSLYTACAGVVPVRTLPITLDVGTENPKLLQDPLYFGLRHKRIRGAEFDAFVDEFVTAANEVFPGVLIQFEDFGNLNAFRVLQRWRDRVCCFNDDIQGTAAVVLAGIYSALRITGEKLRDQRVLCLGAGEAATGICDLIVASMISAGLTEPEARKRCWLVDSKGLVVASRTDLAGHKKPYAHAHAPADFLGALRDLRPTILVGAAGRGGTFTHEVLTTFAAQRERPIVFSLSNPTSQSECTAEQAYGWTDGRAIFASGSPFPSVQCAGRTFVPGQANNSYVFPGIGLGAIASRAKRITDEMFLATARKLADLVTEDDLASGRIYPSLSRIQEVSAEIAAAVCEVAFARGLSDKPRPQDLLGYVKGQMYRPFYD
jgi:malate dehydrogenase (oxaloacetate-decarboxylating)(NADP+)